MEDTTSCWRDVENVLRAGIDRLLLIGPPGTGKTMAGMTMGDTSRGAWRVPCTEDMTEAQLTGHIMPIGDEWDWNMGPVGKALEVQGRVVLDEIDRLSGDVLSLALAITDSNESIAWDHPLTGKRFTAGDGYSVVATSNIEDPRELDPALADRFNIVIRIDRPHPDALLSLPRYLRPIAERSADLGDRRISIRSFQSFDKLQRSIPIEEAARIVFRDRAESILDAIAIDGVAR
jgi:MoxR-like ATPase